MALSHAILAALADKSCSGYDLAKRFQGSVGFFWQATFQQIYRELGKLEAGELIEAQTVHQESRPDKKVYRLTSAGEAYLAEWIAGPCDMGVLKDDLLVKLFAGHLVPKEMIVTELERHRQLHLERLEVYRGLEAKFFAEPEALTIADKYRYITLRNGINYETGWLAWCEEALSHII